MITNLHIENFRSIRKASLDLGRFTILNGANNSGKSSVLYALQVLRNVVTNPNRSIDGLLNLGFLNLGGLENTLFLKDVSKELSIGIVASDSKINEVGLLSRYTLELGNKKSSLKINANANGLDYNSFLNVSFPYPLNKSRLTGNIRWNGIQAVVDPNEPKPNWGSTMTQEAVLNSFDIPIIHLIGSEIIPTHRGFSKPTHNQVPLNGSIQTEEEVATHLAIDKTLQAKVSHYFEKITGKRFSVSMGPGGGFFYLQVREHDTPFTTELVNQGMGINQILFLLAKILYDKNRLVGIDEPEIHLHPTLIERFVKVLVEIAEKEDKQFIFSTHSEHWLLSMLAEVNDGNLQAEDLKVYYLYKDGQETKIENQTVQSNGQIEGGLRNFLDAEMHLTQRFLD